MAMSGPNIPVRYTKRINSRRLNQMNGDFLLHLKTNSVRSEFGQHVNGLNSAVNLEMKKKVDSWYRDQKHALARLTKGQGSVYKTLLRVHQEKKKIAKKQEEKKKNRVSSVSGKSAKNRAVIASKMRGIESSPAGDATELERAHVEPKNGENGNISSQAFNKEGYNGQLNKPRSTVGVDSGDDNDRGGDRVSSVLNTDDSNRNELSKSVNFSVATNGDRPDPSHILQDEISQYNPETQERHKQKTPEISQIKDKKQQYVPNFTAVGKVRRAKVLEVRKENLKAPSTVIRKEFSEDYEDSVADNTVLQRYLREQVLLTGDGAREEANTARESPLGTIQIGGQAESKSPPHTIDRNNNILSNDRFHLKGDFKDTDSGIVIETGKDTLPSHRGSSDNGVTPEEDAPLSCRGIQMEVRSPSPVREHIVNKLHEDYRKMRSKDADASLPPLKKVHIYSPTRLPPDSYLKANAFRHAAKDPIEEVSNANKYFEFPRPSVKETLETWYDQKIADKKRIRNRRPTMVELNNIYASLKEMKKREILNEPFQVYRKDSIGNIIADELPHRRAAFPLPSNKAKTVRQHLLQEERHNLRTNRRKLDNFFQTISNEEEKKRAKIAEMEPIDPEELPTTIDPGPNISLPEYLLKIYKQIELPEGLDPNSAEALHYCKYLRPYSPKSLQARLEYDGSNRRMSSWNPKGFVAPPTELLQSITE